MVTETIYLGLWAFSLLASYVALREAGVRPVNKFLAETGSIWAAFMWALTAFHSFNVVRGSTTVRGSSHSSLGIFALVSGLIMVAFFILIWTGKLFAEGDYGRARAPQEPEGRIAPQGERGGSLMDQRGR